MPTLSASRNWQQERGFIQLYRPGESCRCPCCGRRQWIVGRLMAECASCEAALPLDQVHGAGAVARFVRSPEHDAFPFVKTGSA